MRLGFLQKGIPDKAPKNLGVSSCSLVQRRNQRGIRHFVRFFIPRADPRFPPPYFGNAEPWKKKPCTNAPLNHQDKVEIGSPSLTVGCFFPLFLHRWAKYVQFRSPHLEECHWTLNNLIIHRTCIENFIYITK